MQLPGGNPLHDDLTGPSTLESPGFVALPAATGQGARPKVPDYELLRPVGGGAYGEVWLGRSKATGVFRAVKIVWRRTFQDDRPFEREFEGIQKFEGVSRAHPGQLALFHIGRNEAEGYFYYVMELADDLSVECGVRNAECSDGRAQTVPGATAEPGLVSSTAQRRSSTPHSAFGTPHSYVPHTLRADLAQGRLPATRVLEVGLALAEALAHLHSHGLVHRDVKPSNVIFMNGRPKLADIGLVTDASDTCSLVGTEGYLPPEGPGSPQADLFALGKVLYEAATGMDRRAFPKLPDDLRSWPDAKLVCELNEVILKACAAEPRQRYGSAATILGELALLQTGKSVRRKRLLQWCGALGKRAGLVLGLLGIGSALVSLSLRPWKWTESYGEGPDSTNWEANALCAKGMLIMKDDNYAEFTNIDTDLRQAIALDTNFARPYLGLLELQVREDAPGLPPKTLDSLRAIARELERLAPDRPATYCAKSVVSYGEENYAEALRYSRLAIKADPKYELGHTFYGWLLICFGWTEKAREQLEIARPLAPSKTITFRALGNFELAARRYTNAIELYKRAIIWEPHHLAPYAKIGEAYEAMGDYTNAFNYFERHDLLLSTNETAIRRNFEALRRQVLEPGGVHAYWLDRWADTQQHPDRDFCWKAIIQIHLGNTNAALDWLETSCRMRERDDDNYQPFLSDLLLDANWDGLHDHPRFKRLLEQAGLAKVMPRG